MTNQSKKDKVLDRIRKLLKLAQDSGATESEAAAAMGKVQEILAAHNLDMSEVNLDTEEDEQIQGHRGRETGKNNTWETHIFAGAADLNFCSYYTSRVFHGNTIKKLVHITVGKSINVTASELLAEYLVSTVNRMAKDFSKTEEAKFAALIADTSVAMAAHRYRQGMAIKLRRRMIDLKEQRSKSATTTSTGTRLPALQDAYEASKRQIDLWFEQMDLGLKSVKGKMSNTGPALNMGYNDGDKVNLDQQIEGASAVPAGYMIGGK